MLTDLGVSKLGTGHSGEDSSLLHGVWASGGKTQRMGVRDLVSGCWDHLKALSVTCLG